MLGMYHFALGRPPESFGLDDLDRRLKEDGTVWINLSEPSEDEFNSVAQYFNWHPLAIEDCLKENHLPKVDDYDDYLLIVLHGIDVDSTTLEFDSKEIEVFLAPNYLVTHQRLSMGATAELHKRCESNPSLASRGPSYMLYLLLDAMSDVYLPYLDQIDGRIEEVEHDLIQSPTRDTLQAIYGLRRDVIGLRRVVTPQIEVMRRLARTEFHVTPDESAAYFRDIYDDLFRIIQSADSYRELLAGALDSYLSALSNEMNQVMKVLTIFASIMLPLTFLAGIWGMNFRFMPEIDERWGYPFALGLMATVALTLAWFFKRKRWM